MNANMHTAFDAASGGTASAVAMVIVLAFAATIIVWGANAVRLLLIELMHDPRRYGRNCRLVIRALIIVMTFIYLIS